MSNLIRVQQGGEGTEATRTSRPGAQHLTCPFCNSYDVSRMFLASLKLDSCECANCRARWDEECGSGEYRGRAQQSSVVIRTSD